MTQKYLSGGHLPVQMHRDFRAYGEATVYPSRLVKQVAIAH
jgi:hypothetical protein